MPFNEYLDNDYFRGVQIVDVDLETMGLAVRGVVENAGQVDRSFLEQSRLMVLGNRELAVADIDDRDNPIVTANLELTRNIVDFKPIDGQGYGVQLVGEYNEPAELRIVDLSNADAEKTDAYATISVGASAGEMFVSGTTVTVYSRSYTDEGPQARLTNFDVSSPFKPFMTGSLDLAVGYGNDVRPLMLTRFVPTADIVRVQKGLFVVSAPEEDGQRYSLIDNRDPMNPFISYEHHKANDDTRVLDLKAWWGNLYVVSYEPVAAETEPLGEDDNVIAIDRGQQDDVALDVVRMPPLQTRRDRVRYSVTRVTFDNGTPHIGDSVNVPGRLVDVSKNGKILTMLDQRWQGSDDNTQQKKELFTVRATWNKDEGKLLDGVPLTSGVSDVKVRGKAAYYTEQWNDWRGPIVPLAETVEAGQELVVPEPEESGLKLIVLNYNDPAKVSVASKTTINDQGSYGQLEEVRQVNGTRFAFISMGWGAMSVMDVTDSSDVQLHEFVRSNAWSNMLTVAPDMGAAFMAGGYYGVETINLAGGKN